MISLLRFISPNSLVKVLSSQLGVDPSVVETAVNVVNGGVSDFTAEPFSVLPIAQSVISGGGIEAVPDVFKSVVRDRKTWSHLARLAQEYVEANDPSGSVMQLFSRISTLPLKGFDADHSDLAHFLEDALFPLALEAVGNEPCPGCGSDSVNDVVSFGDSVTLCAVCTHVYEV